ncbi:type II secretion system protein E, partial [Xylophilus sp. Kf1]|nr:type II secretion system protein E [Xylophilus sp. Kf1]
VDQARAETKLELKKLAATGDIDAAMAFIVHHKMNALIAGATDSGKTVFARKMLSYVSDSERMITIEDAAELVPTQPNVVTLIADRDSRTR